MRARLTGLLLFLSSVQALAAPSCPIPQALSFKVEREIHRDALGFTEGLEVHDGAIWESTGDFFGESRINRIDPKTGHVTTLLNAGKHYFGEGMTFFGGRIYQMTWREHRVFVFDNDMRAQPGDFIIRAATIRCSPRAIWQWENGESDAPVLSGDGGPRCVGAPGEQHGQPQVEGEEAI